MTRLTKKVSEFEAGDFFFILDNCFEVLELDEPVMSDVWVNGKLTQVGTVRMLLDTDTHTGWDTFTLTDDLCLISHSSFKKMQKALV